ncbi:unnamed protein product, partial [Trichogramma brassicae]
MFQNKSQCHKSELQVTASCPRLEIAPSVRALTKTSRIFLSFHQNYTLKTTISDLNFFQLKLKSEVAVNTLQQSWCNYVKDPADDIDTHISKIENMAFKLNVMDIKCSDQDVICKILNTLPEAYSHFLTSWESTSKVERTKDNLITRLSIEEERMQNREVLKSKALAANLQSDKSKKDDYSHFRSVYFLNLKSDAKRCIKDFVLKSEKHCPKGIKTMRTDNGLEFVCKDVQELLSEHDITHERTVVHTPEQNGSAERENRTVVEAARTVLQSSEFPVSFWAEAIKTVTYVLNRTSTSSVKGKTPFELWYNKKPNLKELHIFGQEVYSHIPKIQRRKWDAKAKRGFFIGYEDNTKGYRIWHPHTGKIEIARDVIFGKSGTPFEDKSQLSYLYFPGEEDNEASIYEKDRSFKNDETQDKKEQTESASETDDSDDSMYSLNQTVKEEPSDTSGIVSTENSCTPHQPYKDRLRDPSLRKQPTRYGSSSLFEEALVELNHRVFVKNALSLNNSAAVLVCYGYCCCCRC